MLLSDSFFNVCCFEGCYMGLEVGHQGEATSLVHRTPEAVFLNVSMECHDPQTGV